MLNRYLLAAFATIVALFVSMANGTFAQSDNWNASTEVVSVLIVDDPRRVLRSVTERSLEEEFTAWIEMAHRPAYIVVANPGPGRVIEVPEGEWSGGDKVNLAVESVNSAARSPTVSSTYWDRVNGIRRKHLRKAAGQLDLRISVWGRQSLFGPQANPEGEDTSTQTTDSSTVRARPPTYAPPAWETVLGWWVCFILTLGAAGCGVVGAGQVFGWVHNWRARTATTPSRQGSLHRVSSTDNEARREDRPSPSAWSFTPSREKEGDNRSSSSNSTSGTMSRNFRRFTQDGWALLIGATLIFAQLGSTDACAERAAGSPLASLGPPHADLVIEETHSRAQCSFKQSLLQWSHLERSEAESKDLPEWSENAGFKEILRSLGSSLRMTSPLRPQKDLLNVHQEGSGIDRVLVLDASGSIYDRSIQVAQDRLVDWTNQGFRTRVYALGDHLIEVGDVPPGTSASAIREFLNDIERTQHTRLAESLIDLHNRVQKLRAGGERPLVWIASDFVEDTEFAGMSALSFSAPDSSQLASSGEADVDSAGSAQAGGHRGTRQIPWWWVIAGGVAGIVASSLVWGIAWRHRDDTLGNSILDRVEVVMPTNADEETHSARSLLRQGSVPIPDDLPPSEVKVGTSEDEPGTVSVVLAPSAVPDGEVEGSSDETSSAPQRGRAETERSPFRWEPTH